MRKPDRIRLLYPAWILLRACLASLLLLLGCSQEAVSNFTLPEARGGSVALSDYRGKQPVLLFFHMAVG
jgi:hypothetical protein